MANMSFGGGNQSSYYDLARKGQIFVAQAIVTAPVGYATAAATGGPLLWNGTGAAGTNQFAGGGSYSANAAQVDAVILGVTWGVTTAETTTNIALGVTGGAGQTAAPSSTTAIDGLTCTRFGTTVPSPQCNVYRKGTPSAAGAWFMSLATLSTTAVTAMPHEPNYVDLAGMFMVQPNGWFSVTASATGTAAVLQISLIWAEIPRL
jgi:hypothetical protein